MIQTKLEMMNENQMRETKHKLNITGWKKTNDCMWVKVYRLREMEVILLREY